MPQGIYAIVNVVSGTLYVGSSIDIFDRFDGHIRDLKNNKHPCPPLQHAWFIYGRSAFALELLELVADRENLLIREQYYLDTVTQKYNCCKIAGRPPDRTGAKFSPESLERLSQSHIGIRRSEESRRKSSEKMKGVPHSPEHTRKIVESLEGKRGGWHHTDEAKKRISKSHLGRKWDEEFGKKVSKAKKEKKLKHTDETKRKIGDSLREYHKRQLVEEDGS